jgi:hypothetical protein
MRIIPCKIRLKFILASEDPRAFYIDLVNIVRRLMDACITSSRLTNPLS